MNTVGATRFTIDTLVPELRPAFSLPMRRRFHLERRIPDLKRLVVYDPKTRIRTPSGRLAEVKFYDADNRVHVRYIGSDRASDNEQGMFPASLLTQFSRVPE